MNEDEALEIIELWEEYESRTCYCNATESPPCGACESFPENIGEEEYDQALTYIEKKENEMNKTIIELFPQTKDAVLINKHFGDRLNDPLFAMLLKGKEKELLEEANKLEESENKDE